MVLNKLILEKYATDFRVKNGIGSREPIRLRSLLAQLNVIVMFKPLKQNISGMAIKVKEENYDVLFMLVNSNHNMGKQHFTICHELYHLFIQKDFNSVNCITGQFKRDSGEEYNADIFASILILPEDGIKSHIPENELGFDKISIKTILKIESIFSCSRTALLYRLKELKLISSKTYDKYCVNVKKSALLHGYDLDLYNPGNHNLVIGDYGVLARELYDNERISEMHYLSLLKEMDMNNEEFENLKNGQEE